MDFVKLVPWAALVAAVVALVTLLFERIVANRGRRHEVFGDAYRSGVEWLEVVYRVRRRGAGAHEANGTAGAERSIVDHVHDLQERIAFNKGWLNAESASLARAYDAYIKAIKSETFDLIRQAWAEEPRPREEWTRDGDDHPSGEVVEGAQAAFLLACRQRLSLNPVRRCLLWQKYRKPKA